VDVSIQLSGWGVGEQLISGPGHLSTGGWNYLDFSPKLHSQLREFLRQSRIGLTYMLSRRLLSRKLWLVQLFSSTYSSGFTRKAYLTQTPIPEVSARARSDALLAVFSVASTSNAPSPSALGVTLLRCGLDGQQVRSFSSNSSKQVAEERKDNGQRGVEAQAERITPTDNQSSTPRTASAQGPAASAADASSKQHLSKDKDAWEDRLKARQKPGGSGSGGRDSGLWDWITSSRYISVVVGSFAVLAISGGVLYYYYHEEIQNYLKSLAVDVTSSTIVDEKTHTSAVILTSKVAEDLLSRLEVISNVTEFVKSIINNEQTLSAAVDLIVKLAHEERTRTAVTELAAVMIDRLSHDPTTVANLATLLQMAISRKDTQELVVSVLTSALKDPGVQKAALESMVQVLHRALDDEHLREHAIVLLKAVVSDANLQQATGTALWQTLKAAVSTSWFKKHTATQAQTTTSSTGDSKWTKPSSPTPQAQDQSHDSISINFSSEGMLGDTSGTVQTPQDNAAQSTEAVSLTPTPDSAEQSIIQSSPLLSNETTATGAAVSDAAIASEPSPRKEDVPAVNTSDNSSEWSVSSSVTETATEADPVHVDPRPRVSGSTSGPTQAQSVELPNPVQASSVVTPSQASASTSAAGRTMSLSRAERLPSALSMIGDPEIKPQSNSHNHNHSHSHSQRELPQDDAPKHANVN